MRALFILPVILCVYSQFSFAACSPYGGQRTINVTNIVVQRDAPINTHLGTFNSAAGTSFTCDGDLNNNGMTIGGKAYGTYVTTIGSERIYKTNIEGIGYSFGAASMCNLSWYFVGSHPWDGNNNNISTCLNSGTWREMNSRYAIRLYKIGNTGSGTVTGKQVGSGILKYKNYTSWANELPVRINSFTVTTLACSVNTTDIEVQLGSVPKKDFSGVGSSAKSREFNIGLNCAPGARINISMYWEQNKDTTDETIIALTNQGSQDVAATGVGLQILYSGVPVKRNTNMFLKASSGGLETFPMVARYLQTKPQVTAGKADAVATFTVTYR